MSSLGSLNIYLSLETAQFQQGLSKSIAQTQHFTKTFVVDMDKAQRSARQFADRTTAYLGNIEKVAKEFIKLAGSHTELSNKLKLVSKNELQHAQAMSAVYDISENSTIYASFFFCLSDFCLKCQRTWHYCTRRCPQRSWPGYQIKRKKSVV